MPRIERAVDSSKRSIILTFKFHSFSPLNNQVHPSHVNAYRVRAFGVDITSQNLNQFVSLREKAEI